jgi:hypothetical protein
MPAARAQQPARPQQPASPFATLQQRTQTVLTRLSQMEQRWPGGKTPLWAEVFRTDPKPYTRLLREVLIVVRQSPDWGNRPITMIDVSQWVRALSARAHALDRLLTSGENGERPNLGAWQEQLLRVHHAYVRTLITSYVYLEMVKRAYLCEGGSDLLPEDAREARHALADDMNGMHEALQALMETMRSMREADALRDRMPYHSSQSSPLWEERYAEGYFYRKQLNFLQARYAIRQLTQFFAPFTLPEVQERPDETPESPEGTAGEWYWNGQSWEFQPGVRPGATPESPLTPPPQPRTPAPAPGNRGTPPPVNPQDPPPPPDDDPPQPGHDRRPARPTVPAEGRMVRNA